MSQFVAQSAIIQLALVDETRALAMDGVSSPEIQARDNYHANGVPFDGITFHDIGEAYDKGTVGTHDVGYKIACTLVAANNGDAILTSDWLLSWRETIRRRFTDARLPVPEADGIKQHNCRVVAGDPANSKNFPNHRIHQLVIVVWNRETGVTSRTRP